MPVTDGYTMIQVRKSQREALRELAWQQRKPIYKVLEAIIDEATIDTQTSTSAEEKTRRTDHVAAGE